MGRFKYAYEGVPESLLGSYELYSDFLRNSYASVAWIKGYATWNLSVQDPILAGTPTLVYDSPMMREVLGDNYPFISRQRMIFNINYKISQITSLIKYPNMMRSFVETW